MITQMSRCQIQKVIKIRVLEDCMTYSEDWISPHVPPIDTNQAPCEHSWPSLCLRSSQVFWAPQFQRFGTSSNNSPPSPDSFLHQAEPCLKWDGKLRIPKARLGHDERGARLQLTIDPLTFNWAYIISEHKINFSGEVGQIKQLVPVFFSGSLWTAATPQKWALRHAVCLHISWNWVWIYSIFTRQ